MDDLRIPSTPAGRRAWLLYRLRLVGLDFGKIAKELGLDRSTPRTALWRPYPRMERVIAGKLGLAPQQIWPERYNDAGEPLVRERLCTHAGTIAQGSKTGNPKRLRGAA
jgi:Ner family transcriptional regulator